jgi:CRP-like cAMP-binding protein
MFARASVSLPEFPGIFSQSSPEDRSPIRLNLNEFSYKKGSEIFGEKEPADYVYQVMSGAVRSYKLLSDGRRQIGAFHLAAGILALPMCRRDIADYLGLTLETVSRALSRLHALGILVFIGNNQRQIVLRDRDKLASLDLQH